MTFRGSSHSGDGGIARLTLNQPDKLNALAWGRREEIAKAKRKASKDAGRGRCSFLEPREPVFHGRC